ncbi:MAG: hypothetical protein C5B58_04020 [Acidobacteria bacterium]|nr:MAG: hypothetical protein C5B58_04020 [Acidobacteriota bacterium]
MQLDTIAVQNGTQRSVVLRIPDSKMLHIVSSEATGHLLFFYGKFPESGRMGGFPFSFYKTDDYWQAFPCASQQQRSECLITRKFGYIRRWLGSGNDVVSLARLLPVLSRICVSARRMAASTNRQFSTLEWDMAGLSLIRWKNDRFREKNDAGNFEIWRSGFERGAILVQEQSHLFLASPASHTLTHGTAWRIVYAGSSRLKTKIPQLKQALEGRALTVFLCTSSPAQRTYTTCIAFLLGIASGGSLLSRKSPSRARDQRSRRQFVVLPGFRDRL